jgi:hypothetical protein
MLRCIRPYNITLIGSAEAAAEAPEVPVVFQEDLSPADIVAAERAEDAVALSGAEGMIVPLQNRPSKRDDGKVVQSLAFLSTFQLSAPSTAAVPRCFFSFFLFFFVRQTNRIVSLDWHALCVPVIVPMTITGHHLPVQLSGEWEAATLD